MGTSATAGSSDADDRTEPSLDKRERPALASAAAAIVKRLKTSKSTAE
jgi:hypothetical protein